MEREREGDPNTKERRGEDDVPVADEICHKGDARGGLS